MTEETSIAKNGGRLLGEAFITPGASLLLDGQIKPGLAHVGVGLIARLTLGLPGLILVAANSYSKTVTGKSLLQNCKGACSKGSVKDSDTPAITAVTES
ncbi:MAG: hypothetical protein GXP18_08555 [Gammaproteobacteria bacterium]|nr:hypothetical protein [Gammaproteobacteria bacterium]